MKRRLRGGWPMVVLVIAGSSLAACGGEQGARRSWELAPARYVPSLLRALGNEDSAVRRSAAIALGRIGPAAKQAVPSLTCALGDDNPAVRCCAARALTRIDPAPEVDAE